MLLVVISSALTVALIVMLVANAIPARSPGVKARMAELELDGMFAADAAAKRARRRSHPCCRRSGRRSCWSRSRRSHSRRET